MTKNRSNQSWIHKHIKDPYVRMAKQEGYRARSVYKLKEIDEQDKLIRNGQVIVDLGASPGSWSQYIRNKLAQKKKRSLTCGSNINGVILALDMLPMDTISDVQFVQGDFREEEVLRQLKLELRGQLIDLVTSDISPNLSGIATIDSVRIEHICNIVLEFSKNHLKQTGTLLIKCFHGNGYSQIIEKFRYLFEEVLERKPKASLSRSAETFILGRHLKNEHF